MQSLLNTAIIVAAGSGSRLGGNIPKQFLLLDGKEILSYSVAAFAQHPDIHDIIIVTSQAFLDHVSYEYPHCQVVLGGETRQDSVGRGLLACPESTTNVLVHDAARPFISDEVVSNCLSALENHDGAAPAMIPADSMVKVNGREIENLNRADLRIVQTPQCLKFDVLKRAHASGLVDTDEFGLVRQAIPEADLTFVQGQAETMKITHPDDLELARVYLKRRSELLTDPGA